jgi:hypothetical protein
MECVAGDLETFDLVPDHEFATLQFDDAEIVRREMHERVVQFAFEDPVFTFQFNEMRL